MRAAQREAWLLRETAGIMVPMEQGEAGTTLFPATPRSPTPSTHSEDMTRFAEDGDILRSPSLPRNTSWSYGRLTAFKAELFLIAN